MDVSSCAQLSANPCPGHVTGISALLFTNLLQSIFKAQCDLASPDLNPPDVSDFLQEYDFIVVGAGSAGSVVANRLSEINKWNILLLEAGGDPPATTEIPSLFYNLIGTEVDWKYLAEGNGKSFLGMKDGKARWPRGKVLGGTSTINGMFYVRGNKKDFDQWESLGNQGWSYKDVLPYFKKSQDMKSRGDFESEYHSSGGYLTVEDFGEDKYFDSIILEAAKEMGYKVRDYNGEKQTGFRISQATIRNGTRCSTAKAFLNPIQDRTNLDVAKFALVHKIIIDEQTKEVFGVKFTKDGKIFEIKVKKEVIISAGTINSPQLLMLSGIGPKDHLEEFSISVIKDLKVGYNLHDHVAFIGPTFFYKELLKPVSTYDSYYNFLQYRTGPLSTVSCSQIVGFINTKFSDPSVDHPDIQLAFIVFRGEDIQAKYTLKEKLGLNDEVFKAVFQPETNRDIYIPLVQVVRPKSRGYVKLTSSTFSDPLIYPNYLDDPDDINRIVDGIKFTINMSKTDTMKLAESELCREAIPGCSSLPFGSDAYWECAARHASYTFFHPVGTCKMGPSSDPEAVVDPELKIHGVRGLRVIDASIMPFVVTGNTNAAAIMIGEKGADLVKQTWL